MQKVGVEVVGLGALKLTGFLREQMQQNNMSFESMYTVRTLKECGERDYFYIEIISVILSDTLLVACFYETFRMKTGLNPRRDCNCCNKIQRHGIRFVPVGLLSEPDLLAAEKRESKAISLQQLHRGASDSGLSDLNKIKECQESVAIKPVKKMNKVYKKELHSYCSLLHLGACYQHKGCTSTTYCSKECHSSL
ncbi:hypothetical protein Ahy_Scaffold1g107262 [Arachis hypogaea]|uniref:Uncharacterized protein n=1 Tax=Arachis hypogaea TaxID=3818 RepID=A0A444WV13_ARAHY|nr:hypothetical protein Ahy_Scaffold1g107262 [Arachis hypogaea]